MALFYTVILRMASDCSGIFSYSLVLPIISLDNLVEFEPAVMPWHKIGLYFEELSGHVSMCHNYS